jgi:hypothetical protein
MKSKSSIVLFTLLAFAVVFLIFVYFITRNSKNILAQEVVFIYENNTKNKPQNLQTNLAELDKRYFNNQLKVIPQWDNFSFTGAQVIKAKNEQPVLMLFYQNNSYQSPLITLVYSNEYVKQSTVKPYKKWNTAFITYKDYEMPFFEKDEYVYVAVCAFNTITHLNGAIDLNREKDWQLTLKSLQWIPITL